MADRVLPSKLVDERITVRFNFTDELEWGEAITDANFSIQVLSGVDTTPQLMLTGGVTILGTYVSHKIWRGLPGVIYQVVATVEGSTGNSYQKVAKLAILPSDAITPPLDATFYTSRIYPIEVIEAVASGADNLFAQLITQPIDGLRSNAVILNGVLSQILVTYTSPPEGINSSADLLGGTMFSAIKSYTMRPEGINSTAAVLSGQIEVLLITYSNAKAEGINSTATVLSGTLT